MSLWLCAFMAIGSIDHTHTHNCFSPNLISTRKQKTTKWKRKGKKEHVQVLQIGVSSLMGAFSQ